MSDGGLCNYPTFPWQRSCLTRIVRDRAAAILRDSSLLIPVRILLARCVHCRVYDPCLTGSFTSPTLITTFRSMAAAWKTAAKSAAPKSRTSAKSKSGTAAKPKLLSGGNPQIAKGYGDAPVQAYIAAMPGWKQGVGRRLDALIERAVPGVRKAVKWNSPFYDAGDEEQGTSACIASRSTSRSGSSAARRCARFLPAFRSTRQCGTSTSTKTNSTKPSSPRGCSRPASCPANDCERGPAC